MTFVTKAFDPEMSQPESCALIPIIVNMQLANDVANKSVGENVLPKPLLSIGASVEIFDELLIWMASVLSSPK
jgi:hypothetical protein